MDTFFNQTSCDRCSASLKEGRIMSMYNKDCICMECKKEEKERDDYDKAREAELNAVREGNYNFEGIGLDQRFYFTFGTSEVYPYQGGWVEVYAPNKRSAIEKFNNKFGYTKDGFVRCCSYYSEKEMTEADMLDGSGNLGAFCHEVLK